MTVYLQYQCSNLPRNKLTLASDCPKLTWRKQIKYENVFKQMMNKYVYKSVYQMREKKRGEEHTTQNVLQGIIVVLYIVPAVSPKLRSVRFCHIKLIIIGILRYKYQMNLQRTPKILNEGVGWMQLKRTTQQGENKIKNFEQEKYWSSKLLMHVRESNMSRRLQHLVILSTIFLDIKNKWFEPTIREAIVDIYIVDKFETQKQGTSTSSIPVNDTKYIS